MSETRTEPIRLEIENKILTVKKISYYIQISDHNVMGSVRRVRSLFPSLCAEPHASRSEPKGTLEYKL